MSEEYFKNKGPQPTQCQFCTGLTATGHRCEITPWDGHKTDVCPLCYDCRATRYKEPNNSDLLKAILLVGNLILGAIKQLSENR